MKRALFAVLLVWGAGAMCDTEKTEKLDPLDRDELVILERVFGYMPDDEFYSMFNKCYQEMSEDSSRLGKMDTFKKCVCRESGEGIRPSLFKRSKASDLFDAFIKEGAQRVRVNRVEIKQNK